MARQPTLAEILADDTGKIRAEVADLLLEQHASRAQAARRAGPLDRPIGTGWLILFIFVMLAFIVIRELTSPNTDQIEPVETSEIEATIPASEPIVEIPVSKRGVVIADNVNIRTQPGLQGNIIEIANHEENMNVVSFTNGWYEVALPGGRGGYIFGAYLLPQNFDSYPYQVAVIKNSQAKVLMSRDNDPYYFEILWPDGQRTMVLKDDVAIYK